MGGLVLRDQGDGWSLDVAYLAELDVEAIAFVLDQLHRSVDL
jgi:hypothetical protein